IVFSDSQSLERVVRKLAYRAGQEPTIAQPIVEGIIKPEGFRVHIVLDTVSRRGHSFTIRKFRAEPFTIVELISRGTLDAAVAALLWMAAENKQGIIIYGPTGAGKTTLLNAIAMLLPPEMKIVTAEDTPEIVLPFHENWVAMVTRLSTDPKVQNVTLQAQVESAMRQRPDVLILGEIRSREAYSFFQAVSTGHGGLTTVHAESVEALIRRLTSPPMSVPKALIATSKLFVQILRLIIGGNVERKIVVIHEVDRYDAERNAIYVRTLARWVRDEDTWKISLKSSLLQSIADMLALSYDDVVYDLYRRATVLYWATKHKLDLISLHTLVRRYRRDPQSVYDEIVKELGEPYRIKVLESEEIKSV
ncbi:MAG TPA: ATP-binding cassette domain-containing protein, partial [Ignisphaera aggregans]|nr:ATP-binding cassette domain-containing protein [Ignisphaera aggregans]